jgi:hypothetical protein
MKRTSRREGGTRVRVANVRLVVDVVIYERRDRTVNDMIVEGCYRCSDGTEDERY